MKIEKVPDSNFTVVITLSPEEAKELRNIVGRAIPNNHPGIHLSDLYSRLNGLLNA